MACSRGLSTSFKRQRPQARESGSLVTFLRDLLTVGCSPRPFVLYFFCESEVDYHSFNHCAVLSYWSASYDLVIKRYANTIAASFYGHTHKDEFQLSFSAKSEPINVVRPSSPFDLQLSC